MQVIPIKEYYESKKNKKEPLCPKCKVELQHEINEIKKDGTFFKMMEFTGNAWFHCPICKSEYFVKDYALKLRKK